MSESRQLPPQSVWPLGPDQILGQFSKLAYGVARTYQYRGLSLEDLRQEALLGLVYAAGRYDPECGARFSTYAVYWIKKQILQALDRESAASLLADPLEGQHLEELAAPDTLPAEDPELRLPESLPELERRILVLSCQYQLTLKEISQSLSLPVERVKQLRGKALRRVKSAL